MRCPRAIVFDLDDTLAESFQPPAAAMIDRLITLLDLMPVAILSAASFSRIEADFLHKMAASAHIDSFYIFPNSSAQCFLHEAGEWKCAYGTLFSEDERRAVHEALAAALKETRVEMDSRYPFSIIDRDVEIAFAALGLNAPEEIKRAWDPDKVKRKLLKSVLEQLLPDFEILIGGKTTIDITRKGITKAHGVRWLSERLGIPTTEMLYVGDAFYEGGNDAVVIPTGIATCQVTGPHDTERVIDEIMQQCTVSAH